MLAAAFYASAADVTFADMSCAAALSARRRRYACCCLCRRCQSIQTSFHAAPCRHQRYCRYLTTIRYAIAAAACYADMPAPIAPWLIGALMYAAREGGLPCALSGFVASLLMGAARCYFSAHAAAAFLLIAYDGEDARTYAARHAAVFRAVARRAALRAQQFTRAGMAILKHIICRACLLLFVMLRYDI